MYIDTIYIYIHLGMHIANMLRVCMCMCVFDCCTGIQCICDKVHTVKKSMGANRSHLQRQNGREIDTWICTRYVFMSFFFGQR